MNPNGTDGARGVKRRRPRELEQDEDGRTSLPQPQPTQQPQPRLPDRDRHLLHQLLAQNDLNRRSRLQLLLNQQQVRTAANLPSGAPLNGFLLEQLQRQPARATNSFASAQQPAFSAAGMSHEAIERLFGSLLPAPAQPPAANNQLRELIAMSELLRNQPLPNQPQQVPQQQQNNSLTAAAAAAALSGRAGRLERDLSMSSARVAADLYTAPAAAASSPSNRETGAQQMGSITVCKTVALYTSLDDIRLTPYQCLARKQIEYFEASPKECEGAQGRNRAIVVKQVGIRCRHCPNLPKQQRGAAPGFFPGKLDGIYQAAQNIANTHLLKHCKRVPKEVREELQVLGNRKSAPGAGKHYWAEEAKKAGIDETEKGLFFVTSR